MMERIQAIDVHAHIGQYRGNPNALLESFMSAELCRVVAYARKADICLSIASPLSALLPRGAGDPLTGNQYASKSTEETDGLLQWVVVDPLKHETYAQAADMLRKPKCMGIKIHPEEHRYSILEYGDKIFAFAALNQAVVIAHSGEQNSMPEDYIQFANAYPDVRLILAHLGCGWDGDPSHQVRAIQKSRHGNVYTDTSSARSILPNLIEWAVTEVGADRILFGTDTPLYFAPMQRARIDHAELEDADKRKILYENAAVLFEKSGIDIRNIV